MSCCHCILLLLPFCKCCVNLLTLPLFASMMLLTVTFRFSILIPVSAPSNKCAPSKCVFVHVNKHPFSIMCPFLSKQCYSNKRHYSVTLIALSEYMSTEINHGRSSFNLLALSLITKTVVFIMVSQLLCLHDCTGPSYE